MASTMSRITVAESLGAGERAGLLRPGGARCATWWQNHLPAADVPCRHGAAATVLMAIAVRAEKLKVLRALRLVNARGRARRMWWYAASTRPAVIRRLACARLCGRSGRHDEDGKPLLPSAPISITGDWAGVPFYMRTGKRHERAAQRDHHHLQPVPHDIIQARCGRVCSPTGWLSACSPMRGVKLMMMRQGPWPWWDAPALCALESLLCRGDFEEDYPDAYERLLMAVRARQSGALHAAATRWKRPGAGTDGVIQAWQDGANTLHAYAAGTGRPAAVSSHARAAMTAKWFDGHD